MQDEHEEHNRKTEERIIADVAHYGCHFALVEDEDNLPGFAYTIGFQKSYNHPEIICFGLRVETLGAVLNIVKTEIKRGKVFKAGDMYPDILEGYNVTFLAIDKRNYPDYLGYAGWFYEGWNFDAIQMIWPDKEGFFPWDVDFNSNFRHRQPLLDRNADFKFLEEPNLGVYTTRQVLEGAPVLFVSHEEDGSWQFHAGGQPVVTDGRVVCLEELVKKDDSLNAVFQLRLGKTAWRADLNSPWEFE